MDARGTRNVTDGRSEPRAVDSAPPSRRSYRTPCLRLRALHSSHESNTVEQRATRSPPRQGVIHWCVPDLTAEAILARGRHRRADVRPQRPPHEPGARAVRRRADAADATDAGYTQLDAPGPDTNVVLHSIDADAPRPYRRKAAPTFVIAIAELPEVPDDRVELLARRLPAARPRAREPRA